MNNQTKKDQNQWLIKWTGERFLPWLDLPVPEIHYEHLHRYYFAAQFVKGKTVLDLASGEGYGCAIMAENALQVKGVEIDEISVKHASSRYTQSNVEFLKGSITEVPLEEEKVFDVITCFEAIEHIEDHRQLLSEVKRLLKDEGIFIVSSPNKVLYTDKPCFNNPYHLKELYFHEFSDLLQDYFEHVRMLGQKVMTVSKIWPLGVRRGDHLDVCVRRIEKEFSLVDANEKIPLYFIAIASSSPLTAEGNFSDLTDVSEELHNHLKRMIEERNQLLRHYQAEIEKAYRYIQALQEQVNISAGR